MYLIIALSILLVVLLMFFILILISHKKDITIPFLGKFIKKRYLKSRFKIWDDLRVIDSKKKLSNIRKACFFVHKIETNLFYYLAMVFKSSRDSFILLNCDKKLDECGEDNFVNHVKSQKKITTFSMFSLLLLIVANITTGIIAAYIFPGIFDIRAAIDQTVHDSIVDWERGDADQDYFDFSSGALKMRTASSTVMETLADFSRGVATSTEIYLNPDHIQPKQIPDLLWSGNGTKLDLGENQFESNIGESFAVADNNGGAFIVWDEWEYNQDLGEHEFFVKLVNLNNDGSLDVPISLSEGVSTSSKSEVKIVSNGSGGSIVSWKEYHKVDLWTSWQDIFIQKINDDGQKQGNNIQITNSEIEKQNYKVAITSDYLVFVYRYPLPDPTGTDLYATLYDLSDGSTTTLPIATTSDQQTDHFYLFANENDEVIIAWEDKRDEHLNIYAQKILNNGSLAWGQNGKGIFTPLVASSSINGADGNFKIFDDGLGGAYIAYILTPDEDDDLASSYLTRFDSNGDIPAEWGESKVLRENYTGGGGAALDGNGDLGVFWEDQSIFIFATEVFAQKYNSSGGTEWDNNILTGNKTLYFDNTSAPVGLFNNNDDLITSWHGAELNFGIDVDNQDDNLIEVTLQKTNSDGINLFSQYGERITDFPQGEMDSPEGSSVSIMQTSDGNTMILAYLDGPDNNRYLYAQKISNNIRYDENSFYTSPILDVANPGWENFSLEGDFLDQNVRVETRTSDNLAYIGTPSASSEFDGTLSVGGLVDIITEVDISVDYINDGIGTIVSPSFISGWLSEVGGAVCSVSPSNDWAEIDLGEERTVGCVRGVGIYFVKAFGFYFTTLPLRYAIQTWDGSAWETQIIDDASGSQDTIEHCFDSPVETSKVRILSINHSFLGFTGYMEVEVYEDQDGAWSDWEEVSPEGKIQSPNKRFLQYRLFMEMASTTPPAQIPVIDTVSAEAIPLWHIQGTSPIFTSTVIDAGYGNYGTVWQTIEIEDDIPDGTSIQIETRTGMTATPNGTWSDWSIVNNENISSPVGRFMQYRIIFTSNDPYITPTVNSVTVNYDALEGPGLPADEDSSQLLEGETSCVNYDLYENFATGAYDSNIDLTAKSGYMTLRAKVGSEEDDWEDNGNEIASSPSDQVYQEMSEGSQGEVAVAWQDMRNDSGDIYFQSINNAGERDCDTDGLSVHGNVANTQSDVKMLKNSDYNYLAWLDQRNNNDDIYAQRIQGCLPGGDSWNANGNAISTYTSNKQNIETLWIEADTVGIRGLAVLWEDDRNGVWDIYENIILEDGNLVSPNDLALATSTSNKINHDTIVYNGWDFSSIVVWQDDRNDNGDIYAVKYDSLGQVYPGWIATGTQIAVTNGTQKNPQIIKDGNQGAIIYWEDERDFGTNNTDIYAQRIDSDGAVQWGENGIPVVMASGRQANIKLLEDESLAPYSVLAWEDERNGEEDIYAAMLDENGNNQLTENGEPICTATGRQINPSLAFRGGGLNPYITIVWQDERNDQGDIYAQIASQTGVQWQANGVPLVLATSTQSNPKVIQADSNTMIATWVDGREGYDNIYAQRVLDTPAYQTPGVYESEYIEATDTVAWVTFNSTSTVPNNTIITHETRSTDSDPNLAAANLSLGPLVTATSSSNLILNPDPLVTVDPAWAIDGSTINDFGQNPPIISFWANDNTQGLPAWHEVEFNEEKTVSMVVMKFLSVQGINAFASEYKIETYNGASYDEQAHIQGNSDVNVTTIFDNPVNTEKVRIWIIAANPAFDGEDQEDTVGISEFETYESTEGWSSWELISEDRIQSPRGKYLQFRTTLTTSNTAYAPELDSIQICNSSRPESLMIEYTPVDSESASTTWLALYASTTIPDGTSIEWATRSGDSEIPGQGWDDWATTTYEIVDQHGQYLQYRAYLSTTNALITPEIYKVTVRYLTGDGDEQEQDDEPPVPYTPPGGGTPPIIKPITPPTGNFSCRIAPPADYSGDIPKVDSQIVNLELEGGPQAYNMLVMEGMMLQGKSIVPYSKNYQFTLSEGDGIKDVYVVYFTDQGIMSPHISCPVELDMAPEPYCGDGNIDSGEQCDDGNNINGDGCSANCRIEVAPEPEPVCGDGILDDNEECDDGNNINGDGCSSICEIEIAEPVCGDGVLDENEECDDGNNIDGDGCSAECTIEEVILPSCGDGVLDEGEECDDGNNINCDGCSEECKLEICGDNIICAPETCEPPNTNICDANCQVIIPPKCGDGELDEGEECDDGNNENGDGCSSICIIEVIEPVCGNGIIEENEECDDGNNEDGDGCSPVCTHEKEAPANCGDGILDEGEECDDGNSVNGDGCSSVCTEEPIIKAPTEEKKVTPTRSEPVFESLSRRIPASIRNSLPVVAITNFIERARVELNGPEFKAIASSTPAKATTASLFGAYTVLTLLQFSVQVDAFSKLPSMFINLFGVLFYRRGLRKRQGKVYNVDTGQPIPFARITIYGTDGKAKDTKITDKYGAYFFLVPKGSYSIQAQKRGYEIVTNEESQDANTVYDTIYTKEKVLEYEKEAMINESIPMKLNKTNPLIKLFSKSHVYTIFNILFAIGLIISIIISIADPNIYNYSISIVYVLLAILRNVNFIRPRWGTIATPKGAVQAFTTVQTYNAEDSQFIGRTITDEYGRYAFILDKGEYKIQAKTGEGKLGEGKLKIKRRRIIAKDLIVK